LLLFVPTATLSTEGTMSPLSNTDRHHPPDPYAVLDVAPDASPQDIRSAYKKAALQYHPDKQPRNVNDFERIQAHEQFTKINTAYELLSNPRQRYLYDYQQRGNDHNHASSSSSTVLGRRDSNVTATAAAPVSMSNNNKNPFDILDQIFREEKFGGADIRRTNNDSHPDSSNKKNNVKEMKDDFFQDFFGRPTSLSRRFMTGQHSPPHHHSSSSSSSSTFGDIFRQQEEMMKRMQDDMERQHFGQGGSTNWTSTSSSSSSSSTRMYRNAAGEMVTTTERTIHRSGQAQPETVKETVITNPDGTIKERRVTGDEVLLSPPKRVSSTSSVPQPQLPYDTASNAYNHHQNNKHRSWMTLPSWLGGGGDGGSSSNDSPKGPRDK
jgi:curved DNA-binding protein CbpA